MPTVTVQQVAEEEMASSRRPFKEESEKQAEAIRCRAFEIFEQRGREPGHEVEDWLQAEQEVLGWPAAEIADDGKSYNLKVSLPGVDPKEVKVLVSEHEIAVQAHRDHGTGGDDIYRLFEIAQPIDPARLRAKFGKGTLKITATKIFNDTVDAAPA